MLIGIDPLLTADILKILCEMGHGDEVVVVDANFTAASLGAGKPVMQLSGANLGRACQAVLSVFPLDTDVAQPVAYMKVSHTNEGYVSAVQENVVNLVAKESGTTGQCEAVERFAFYDRVKTAYAIIQTGEMQPYANFIFKKGVISLSE